MIDPELLAMLVCPANRGPLRRANRECLDRLNRAIAAGRVTNQAGRPVTDRLQDGLVRTDGLVLYPIIDNIPVLLVEEGIPLEQVG
ncbi:MAG: Trm112 family protein [Thermoguttaceae bacterium]|jgi:uncharacterized protein YbaR (Trm112 family)